jgi:hypothetical protein
MTDSILNTLKHKIETQYIYCENLAEPNIFHQLFLWIKYSRTNKLNEEEKKEEIHVKKDQEGAKRGKDGNLRLSLIHGARRAPLLGTNSVTEQLGCARAVAAAARSSHFLVKKKRRFTPGCCF